MIHRLTVQKTATGEVDPSSILVESPITRPQRLGTSFIWRETSRGFEASIACVKDWRNASARIVALKQASRNPSGIAYFVEA